MIAEIAAVVPDSLAFMTGTMALGTGHEKRVRPFLESPDFEAMTCRFGATCRSPDCRPVLSLWSLTYFGMLIIPTTVALLCLDRVLPVGFDETSVDLDASGAPRGLRVCHAGRTWRDGDGPRRFDTLCEGHLRPFITGFAARSGLPPRLLWANAATILDFVVRELIAVTEVDADARREAEALIGIGPDGATIDGPLRPYASHGRRKVCCLRYRLPGQLPCAGVCPIEPGARAACNRPCAGRALAAAGMDGADGSV